MHEKTRQWVSDLCDLVRDGVVEGAGHAQVDAVLVELRRNLCYLYGTQILVKVRWIEGGLQVDLTVRLREINVLQISRKQHVLFIFLYHR